LVRRTRIPGWSVRRIDLVPRLLLNALVGEAKTFGGDENIEQPRVANHDVKLVCKQ